MTQIEKKYFYFFSIFSLFVTLPLFVEIPSLWRGDTHSFLAMGCNSYQWFLLGKIDYQPLRPPFYSAFVNFFSGVWNRNDCIDIALEPMSFLNNALYLRNFAFVTFVQYLIYLSSSLFLVFSTYNLFKLKTALKRFIFYFISGFIIYCPGFIVETRSLLPASLQISISFLVCAFLALILQLRKDKNNDENILVRNSILIFISTALIFSISFLVRPTLIFITFFPFLLSVVNLILSIRENKKLLKNLSQQFPKFKKFLKINVAIIFVIVFSLLPFFYILNYKNQVSNYVGYSTISPLGEYVSGSALYDKVALISDKNKWLRDILEETKKNHNRGHYVWAGWGAINEQTCNNPEIRNEYAYVKDCTLIGAKVLKDEVSRIYKQNPLAVMKDIYKSEIWKFYNAPYNPNIRLDKPSISHDSGDPRPNLRRPNPIKIYSIFQLSQISLSYYSFFWRFLLASNFILSLILIIRLIMTRKIFIFAISSLSLYFSSIAFTVMTLVYGSYESHYSAPIYAPLILNLVLISYSLKNEYKFKIN